MERDLAYLLDILNASWLIVRFVEGMTYNAFAEDEKTLAAVIREFEIIGEAAGRVSAPFVADHPELPWRKMISMRNRMTHGYDDIDLEVVWLASCHSIPALIKLVEPFLGNDEE